MRDAILVRKGVKASKARSGTFKTLLRVKPAGVNIDVTRGWTAVDATVRGHKLHFVNTHLEAFDNNPTTNPTNTGKDVGNGQIRAAQAKELIAKGGPARSKLPVILVGDLNSDVKTEVRKGDSLAYRALLKARFVERSTSKHGCCLNADVISESGGASRKDFTHRVDHVMTNASKKVKLVRSRITGGTPFGGWWDSDHQGLVSTLRLR
jgi:endonuclease/exonuclease/phosphatase family metal-dependent hydrolase